MQRFRTEEPQSIQGTARDMSYVEETYRGPYQLPLVRTETDIPYVYAIKSASMVDRLTPSFWSARPSSLPVNSAWKREVNLSYEPAAFSTHCSEYYQLPLYPCGYMTPITSEIIMDNLQGEMNTIKHYFPDSLEDFWSADAPSSELLANYGHLGSQALKTAVSRARQGEMDILTTLVEGRETIQYIKGRAKSIAKLIKRALSNQKLTRRKTTSTEVAGVWLELRFAIRPLVGDIESAIEALASIHETSRKGKALLNGPSSNSVVTGQQTVLTDFGTSHDFSWDVRVIHELSFSAGCWATFSAGMKSFQIDPITTAYELVKLSWLIDYFVDIGDTLSALSPRFGVTVDKCWIHSRLSTRFETQINGANNVTVVDSPEFVCSEDVVWPRLFIEGNWTPPNIKGEIKTWCRKPATTSDMAWTPRIDIDLNLAKFLDIAALITQMSKSKPQTRAMNRLLRL